MTRAVLFLWMLFLVAALSAVRGQSEDINPLSAHAAVERSGDQEALDEPAHSGSKTQDVRSTPLRFRRVYVPEKDLLERVKPGQRYVPMDAAEFESRLRQLTNEHASRVEPAGRIAFARYAASLDSDFQLAGKGTWRIRLAGKEPALVPLPGLRFALHEPRWVTNASTAAGEASKIGATEHGETALYADRSGSLSFDWSLAGTPNRDRGWTFELSFPPSPGQRLELILPEGLIPSVDDAMVSQPEVEGAKRRWTIDLAARSTARLRILKSDSHGAIKPLVLLRPKLTYELSLQGLRLTGEWRLDVQDARIERLEFDLDPSLTLVDVKAGDTTLSWSEVEGGGSGGPKRIAIEFPELLEGNNRLVRLVAVGSLITDRAWTLPVLNVHDVNWQDGTMALVVAAPLSLNRLDLVNCRQTKRETLPLPAAGEAIGLVAFAPNAAVTVHVAQRAEHLELSSATTIDLVGNEAVCSYVADIVARQGERFELSADISPDWIIDTVQSSPAGMIADWERQRGEGNASRLLIHLAKTVNRDRKLRLIINATRRRAPLGDTLEMKDLRLLTFEGVVPARRLALLRTASPYRLDLRQAEGLSRLDTTRLGPADHSLLGDERRGLLFVIDDAAEDLQIKLLQERPRFGASLRTRALVSDRDLAESYDLQISPESNQLEQVLVHFSQTRAADLVWSLEKGDGTQISARRLSQEEQVAAGIDDRGETWEVALKPARTDSFVLSSKRTIPIQPNMSISLPSLVDGTSQHGSVVVELDSEFVPQLQECRLKAVAVDSPPPGEYQNTLAAYAYDPMEDLLVAKDAALTLTIDRDAAHRRRAWIWQCRLEAWFSAAEQIEQRAMCLVENTGRSGVAIGLPTGATLPVVSIDGTRTAIVSFDSETGNLEVPLPAHRRFCTVDINWDAPAGLLGGVSSRSIEPLTADVPVLARCATVWLPSGYALADTGVAGHAFPTKANSWRERVFGPLGRAVGRETFEPWRARDWSQMVGTSLDERSAEEWGSRFADQPAIAPTGPRTDDDRGHVNTWGDCLYRAGRRSALNVNSQPVSLFVHLASLERAGIRPSTVIEMSAAMPRDVQPTIGTLLEQHGLVLLSSGEGVLLANREWAATWCDASIATSRQLVFNIDAAGVSSLLLASASAPSEVTTLETWLALAESSPPFWFGAEQADKEGISREGWIAYPLELPQNEAAIQVIIVRRQTMFGLSLGLFLATAGLACRYGASRPIFRILALGILVIVALSLPVAFASLGAAIVIGFLAGQCIRWLLSRSHQISAQRLEFATLPVATVASGMLLAVLGWTVAAQAEDPPATAPGPAKPSFYDVLIPVDDHEQIAGDKVFVPEALYKELLARTGQKPNQEQYLITSAAYEGVGQRPPTDERALDARNWRAVLSVEVLKAPVRVVLPLGGAGVQLVPDSGKLNGRPLRFGWDAERRSITFDIEAAGAAKVEFEFRPARQDAPASSGLSFAIPAVPQSTLQLTVNKRSDAPQISALGATIVDPASKRLLAQLGPIHQMSATWNLNASRAEIAPQFESEELSWLKVRLGSAVLNSRMTVQVRRGELKELRLAVDDRLRPLPLADDSPIESIERVAENELRLRFATPIAKQATFDLSFVVSNVTGVGAFAWPDVQLIGAQSRKRYVAYTVDPTLEPPAQPAEELRPLSSGQFATLWGEADARPTAFEIPSATPHWQLEVRPRQPKLTSNYRSIVTVEPSQVSLQWNASIDVSGGSRFQLRMALPSDLNIDRVEVRDAAGMRPSRWALDNARTLTVFLDAAASGKLDLSLRGRWPVGQVGRAAVPQLRVEGSTEEKATVLIVRHANALVAVDEGANFPPLDATEVQSFVEASNDSTVERTAARRPLVVAAYQVKNGEGPIVLSVTKNRPQIEAVQAISLSRPNDTWQAALDLRLSVSEGILDVVRIDIPASWSGPLAIDPPMPFEIVEGADESRRVLSIFPLAPIAGEAQLHIEGRLLAAAGGPRVRAPDARVVGATTLAEYFALPLQHGLQTLAWETRGLKAEAIPEGLLRHTSPVQSQQTFARQADQFRAELRSVEKLADDCRVRLADLAITWASDLACYGVALFDIEPAGKPSCLLALPAGYRLVHLSVDGRPVAVAAGEDQRWPVPLGGGRLPLRIEVVFAGAWSAGSTTPGVLEGPRLIGLPVERTLWSISGPRWAGAAQTIDNDLVGPAKFEKTRYETIAGLIESAANTLSEVGSDEAPRWYAPWASRMIACRRSLDRLQLLDGGTDADSVSTGEKDLIEKQQRKVADRLDTQDILARFTEEPPPDESAAAAWSTLARSRGLLHATASGEASSIKLDYSQRYPGDFPARLLQALVAAIIFLTVAALVAYTRVVDWIGRWPRATAAALGLFWWLFLWPSAIGWLIVAASVLFPQIRRFVAGQRRIRQGLLRAS